MRKNLSPELQAFIEVAEQNDGFNIRELPKGALFEMRTCSGSLYTAVVTNPEEHEVALVGGSSTETQEPDLYVLQGSTFGGSACKVGWIGVGLRPRFYIVRGGLIILSQLRSFKIKNDEDRAREILEKAEARRPREATQEDLDKLQGLIEELIDNKFGSEHRDQVREMVHQFCLEGQGVVLGYFDCAQEAGKIDEALTVMSRHFDEHWSFRPKELRGSFITEQDIAYTQMAYKEIGLEPPA